MAEAAVSSGVGALLAPAQSAATQAANAANSSSKDAVNDGNSSSFSTVLAEQGESATELKSTETVVDASEVLSVDETLTKLELVDSDALDSGQLLPQVGNPLPVDVDLAAEVILAGVGAEVATENTDALQFDNLIAQNQSVDQSAAQAIVIDPALLQKITESLQASAAESAAAAKAADNAVDASSLTDGVEVVALATVATISPAVQASSVDTSVEQSTAGAVSLDLISLLDRKAKVSEGLKPIDTASQDLDLEVSGDSEIALSDSLLLKNAKSSFSFNLQGNLDNALLKTADLASAMSPKSSSSLEINALPLWRQQGVQSYSTTQPLSTSIAIDVPVAKPGWGDAVLDKVMWMSSQKLDSAEIALDPVDLGPMHVKISTHNDQTTVVFTSQHIQVREALDQASGQLRQSLENQGFGQVNVDVSGQNAERQLASQAQADGSGNRSGSNDGLSGDQDVSVERLAMSSTDINKLGLIDTFV